MKETIAFNGDNFDEIQSFVKKHVPKCQCKLVYSDESFVIHERGMVGGERVEKGDVVIIFQYGVAVIKEVHVHRIKKDETETHLLYTGNNAWAIAARIEENPMWKERYEIRIRNPYRRVEITYPNGAIFYLEPEKDHYHLESSIQYGVKIIHWNFSAAPKVYC